MAPRLYVKYQVWRGKAIDIGFNNDYPANVLSNESDNAFILDGYGCASMESFMRSLSRRDQREQQIVCRMRGCDAKALGYDGTYAQTLYWNGRSFPRDSRETCDLIRRAYKALFVQNDNFQTALLATQGKWLYCTESRQRYDIACERTFTSILGHLRNHSHEILSEFLQQQTEAIKTITTQLIRRATAVLRPVVEGERMTEPTGISIPANIELFPRGFAFHIVITPPRLTPENAKCTCRLGLMEARVSDTIYTYSRPIGFGTPSYLIGMLATDKMKSKITRILLNGFDHLNRPGY